ncbi:MAG TPA: class II aldolase/adducin family protein [Candidatus Acidoferrales bacterium]|nr:class II aldolase/adducin family protein [Candidatus Acidoferrales bacterium]
MRTKELARLKRDYVTALKIIVDQGLSDAFAHLSARVDGDRMLFMPRKSPALVKPKDLFVVDFEKRVPQSSVHQAIYKRRDDVGAVVHFHSFNIVLLTVGGQTVRPMHNYSVAFYDGVPVFEGVGQVETPERAAKIAELLGSAKAVLLRGHGAVVVGGNIPEVCMLALALDESARLQIEAMKLGEPRFIDAREAERIAQQTFKETSIARAWEHYKARVESRR